VNSLPKTVTRQRRDYDLNPGPSVPESSTLTTRLPSHPILTIALKCTSRGQLTKSSKIGSNPPDQVAAPAPLTLAHTPTLECELEITERGAPVNFGLKAIVCCQLFPITCTVIEIGEWNRQTDGHIAALLNASLMQVGA